MLWELALKLMKSVQFNLQTISTVYLRNRKRFVCRSEFLHNLIEIFVDMITTYYFMLCLVVCAIVKRANNFF